jgi:6-phosphofructokinase 1
LKRIGILTGGGDAPGLNAVIRAVVKSAANCQCETIGILDGFDGLIERDRYRVLTPKDVTGILRIGGTILGTANRGNPLVKPVTTSDGPRDFPHRCIETFRSLQLDSLIVIGGDGTLAIAYELYKRGIPLVGVPKTIDNDIVETTNTFGFDTAVSFATEAVDRLHATGEAHHRIMVAEVMGRHAGWIALYAGVAGGADVILIPEIPFNLEKVAEQIKRRDQLGARFSIVVAAEGAKPLGGSTSVVRHASDEYQEKLGGIGAIVAAQLEALTGKEARCVVLGHLLRGGAPTLVRTPSSWP